MFSTALILVFFCENSQEMNKHLWTCPRSIKILKPIFRKHELIFRALIVNNMDREKYNENDLHGLTPILQLYKKLQNYIVFSLTWFSQSFKDAKIHKSS